MMMIWMVLTSIFVSTASDVNVFDESVIACTAKEKEKNCVLALCGSKSQAWVGHVIFAQRGRSGDVNDFLKSPEAFKSKIKKQTLKEIFGKADRMSTLAGHLDLDNKKQQWSAYVEGQFEKNLDKMETRKFSLKEIYGK